MPYSGIGSEAMDLNADLGETEGDYIELLPIVTSANVACGAHAGGGQLLVDTLRAAKEHSVKVGAHPSYPDRENFGRVSLRGAISEADLIRSITEQIELLKTEAEKLGIKLNHVKAHGALYNDAMVYEDVAISFLAAVVSAAPGLPVLGLPNSKLEALAEEQGIRFIPEGFVDRAYTNQGQLVPRTETGSVLDYERSLVQVREIAKEGTVTTITGNKIKLLVETLCIHADSPDAARSAKAVKDLLLQNQVPVKAFES